MPNIQSEKKSLRKNDRRHKRNLAKKRAVRDVVISYRKRVIEGDRAAAEELLPHVYRAIDKAAKKNIITKNTARRKKSRLTALLSRPAQAGAQDQ